MADEEGRLNEEEQIFDTKIVLFFGRTTRIVLQNDNGPCALLAICNVLQLKNELNLIIDEQKVSLDRLISCVADRLVESNSNTENDYLESQKEIIADAISILPRLATGMDMNLQFRRIDDFEYTPECAIFDLLDIPLYHGWIVDPQDPHTASAIGWKSYDVLMGELVALEKEEGNNSNMEAETTATGGVLESDSRARKGDLEEQEELLKVLHLSCTEVSASEELVRHFLKINASQLTIHGLFCLKEALKEGQLCVFFRNNHFSTMLKFNGELYLLATDHGYLNHPGLVWEKLNEVNGDLMFVTGNFREYDVDSYINYSTWERKNCSALQQLEFDNQSADSNSRLVTGPRLYNCYACPWFDDMDERGMNTHNHKMHKGCRLKCKLCLNAFNDAEDRKIHDSIVHNKPVPRDPVYMCYHCKRSKLSENGIDAHYKHVHKLMTHFCNTCKNYFRSTTIRDTHICPRMD